MDGQLRLAGDQSEEDSGGRDHSQNERALHHDQVVEKVPELLYKRYLMSPDTPPDGKLLKVAILGAPNAGKSTFINKLVGWKVNSVSKKVHTTKGNTNTAMIVDNTQLVFIDTPGVITQAEKRKHKVEVWLEKEPERSLHEADIVGIIVDGGNTWTRNTLHPGIIKALYLYKDMPAFLIINKVDSLPKKLVLLQTIKHLTRGLVGNKSIYTNPYRPDKPLPKEPEQLFQHLEKKYGKLRVDPGWEEAEQTNEGKEQAYNGAKTEAAGAGEAYRSKSVGKDADKKKSSLVGLKIVTLKDLKVKEKDSFDNENSLAEILTDPIESQTHTTEGKAKLETSPSVSERNLNAKRGMLQHSTAISVESYQSDFVKHLLSVHHPEYDLKPSAVESEEECQQQELLREAEIASRTITSWPHFKQVFIISALDGTGVEDVKEYLLSAARPGQWLYHSSVITEQHPYETAKMCIRQALLDNVHGWLPYRIDPLISHWDVSSDDTLHLSIDINVKSSNHMGLIVGMNSDTIKAVSYDAKQALMDAFHCDVKLRLSVTVKKARAGHDRNITFY
ncbi:ERAL1-like protein [Mya arenaria]|uniref:GTPase Era, mitochondrial n=2 Tax=Mya arenaria TaxID=6604 RepID=A0ABY7E5Y3_MYAAR|nr:ERAL1-like protein [Mya arenaria]